MPKSQKNAPEELKKYLTLLKKVKERKEQERKEYVK